MDDICKSVGLHCISCEKCADGSRYCECDGQPLPIGAETFFNVIHRATRNRTILICNPVFLRKGHFRIFYGHSENRGDPHPEKSSRPSKMDGQGYTSNVTDSDSGGQGCTQCLKVIQIPFIVRIIIGSQNDLYTMFKLPELNKSETKCDKNTVSQKNDDHGWQSLGSIPDQI